MRYCARCVLPDTRPGITLLDDGVCNACHAWSETTREVDWSARADDFRRLVDGVKRLKRSYDCVVPVSGGKDSTWQVQLCLEHGLHPLAVTWKTPGRTELGQYNLARLVELGVDHIDFQINPHVERTFMLRTLERSGSTAIPMHMAIFAIPLTIAVRFHVPLIVWGENSADVYGTSDQSLRGHELTKEWLRVFGVTGGTTAEDWVDSELTRQRLTPYFGPSDEELAAAGTRGIFLGYYFGWDPERSLQSALQSGFKVRTAGPKVGYWNYADIDDDFISIHHYLKWYKFGCTRLFDNLAVEIRCGRISRADAISEIRRLGSQYPREDIERLCEFVGITVPQFHALIEKFRNPKIWRCHDGVWTIPNFLVPDWEWRLNEGQ